MTTISAEVPYRSDPRGSGQGSAAPGAAWRSHPLASRGLRVLAVVGPLAAAVAVALVARALVPVPRALVPRGAWAVGVSVPATATMLVVAAGLRRALPLAALLRLSLAFPDEAPSRLRIARCTATDQQARALVTAAVAPGDAGEVAAAATAPGVAIQRCLELVASLAHHDRITRGHCERVRAYCDLIGAELGLSRADRQRLQWAGLLHDIGKVGVLSRVLNKRDRLTDREWEQIKQHPAIGARLTASLEPWLGEWVRGVGEHHERMDGRGYPNGLAGGEISLAARIIAVADAFDVMTAARSYKEPISVADARAELVRCAGSQFDEQVVRAFVTVSVGRLRRVMGPSALLAEIPILGPVALTPTIGGTVAPLATTALAVGGLVFPSASIEDAPVPEPPTASALDRPASGASDSARPHPSTADDGRHPAAPAPGSSPAQGGTTPSPPSPPSTVPPPTSLPPGGGTPTIPTIPTTPTVPEGPDGVVDGVLDPVVDEVVEPVVDDVVDPLLDEVEGGLDDVTETVDEILCALPLFGCS